jgi:8-oxo-dGTP pyrophosphatase MutT (NUDIX family)
MPRRPRDAARLTAVLLTVVVAVMGAGASSPGAGKQPPPQAPAKAAAAVAFPPGIDKLGAGLLLCRCDKSNNVSILLLKRRSKHHGGAWGLPGGNAEPSDAGSLLSTATREAHEELGHGGVPPFVVKVRLDTRRGKRGQKLYAVFVALVDDLDVGSKNYAPKLNAEHSAWRWWSAADVERAAAAAKAGGGSVGKEEEEEEEDGGGQELHPVVALAIKMAGGAKGLGRLLSEGG